MFPVLHLGPLSLRTPGLIWLAAFYLGLTWAERHATRQGLDAERLDRLVLGAVLSGVLAARLGYFLVHPSAWSGLADFLSLDAALLDPWLGALVALIWAEAQRQRWGVPWGALLDALTPLLVTLALGSALAALAAGTAFGQPTDLPWGISLWGMRRHPTQLYLALGILPLVLDLAGWPRALGILPTPREGAPPGGRFLRALAWLAAVWLVVSAWRGDSRLLVYGLRQEQVIAWGVLAASLAGLTWLERRSCEEV